MGARVSSATAYPRYPLSMNTNEARTAWIVAGVLGALLLIALFFWFTTKRDLAGILEEGQHSLATMRQKIVEDCEGLEKDPAQCQKDYDELSALLANLKKDIGQATTSSSTSAY